MQTKGSKHQSKKENEADLQLKETHNQTFTCTKEKTSEASPTPLLKIMLSCASTARSPPQPKLWSRRY